MYSLRGLKRNQTVFVTSGDTWQNPTVCKSEIQKRKLLSKLAADVQKIEEYCLLRDPSDLVLTVGGGLIPGSQIIVAKNLSKQESHDDLLQTVEKPEESEIKDEKVNFLFVY